MMKAEDIMGAPLFDEIRNIDESEIQPEVSSSGKPSEKPKMIIKLVLLCSAFILVWVGYTLFEVVIEFRDEKERVNGVSSLPITKLSHLQCGKIHCSGWNIFY